MTYSIPTRFRIFLTLMIALGCGLLAHTSASAAPPGPDASQACGISMQASNVIELNEAIACFNGQTSGEYTIELTENIRLSILPIITVKTTRIDNSTAAKLRIYGGADKYAINGEERENARPLSIDAGNVTLDRIVIVNGFNSGHGGGIYIGQPANVTINDSIIRENEAVWGGGIYNRGMLTLKNSLVSDNSAYSSGGGIDNAGTFTDNNSQFQLNTARIGGSIYSGADDKSTVISRLTMTDSRIIESKASFKGGGIFNTGIAEIKSAAIQRNTTTYSFDTRRENYDNTGGGIYHGVMTEPAIWFERPQPPAVYAPIMTIRSSDISGNGAVSGGGIDAVSDIAQSKLEQSNLQIYDSLIYENYAEIRFEGGGSAEENCLPTGGGVRIGGMRAFIFGTRIRNNSAGTAGGGIHIRDGANLELGASRVVDNSAPCWGTAEFNIGADNLHNSGVVSIRNSTIDDTSGSDEKFSIANVRDGNTNPEITINNSTIVARYGIRNLDGVLKITNSILAKPTPRQGGGPLCNLIPSTNTISDSLIEDDSCTDGSETNVLVVDDAKLAPVGDNGGQTSTYALLPGSPALDAGNYSLCESTDQRGEVRTTFDPNGKCDMGAFEAQPGEVPYLCEPALDVSTTEELNSAIGCFNKQTAGEYSITLNSNITLDTASRQINNDSSALLTLSGADTFAINGDATHRGLTVIAGNVTIEKMTIANGSTDSCGGGVYNASANLAINDVQLSDNSSTANGGGLCNHTTGDITVNRTSFSGNSAPAGGGFINAGTFVANDITLDNNSATGQGGGFYNTDLGAVTINDGEFTGNSAADGGAMLNRGTITASKVTLTSNSATERGGAVYNSTGADVQVTDSQFFTNQAPLGGGGIYNKGRTTVALSKFQENESELGGALFNSSAAEYMTVRDSAFVVNTGTAAGGGIYNGATLEVNSSSFFGNNGGSVFGPENVGLGGGIFNANAATASIANSTLSNNYSGNAGGGLFTDADGTVKVINSTFADNIAGDADGASIFNQGTTTVSNSILAYGEAVSECVGLATFTNSLVEDGSCGVVDGVNGNLTGDPLLGAKTASANGGPTSTRTLLGGSPAIGTGDNSVCSAAPINGLDQRGVNRDANCDMGAYEFNNDAVIVSWRTAETVVDEDVPTVSLAVDLHKPYTDTVTVDYTTNNGTATGGSDFTDANGTLTFAVGETSKNVDIAITNDAIGENVEYFPVTLSNPSNAELGTPKQTKVIIIDDDQPNVSLSKDAYTVNENDLKATLAVQLNRTSDVTVTVDYRTYNQSAFAVSDYTNISGTLTFAPGQTAQMVEIPIIDDGDVESDETFVFELVNPLNAGYGLVRKATITIIDNDMETMNYSIGGMVSGLAGSGLVLQNNGGDDLAISSNGRFTFSTRLADGSAYKVTVKTQPSTPAQTCTVTKGTGTVTGANVTDVAVSCTNESDRKAYLPVIRK